MREHVAQHSADISGLKTRSATSGVLNVLLPVTLSAVVVDPTAALDSMCSRQRFAGHTAGVSGGSCRADHRVLELHETDVT